MMAPGVSPAAVKAPDGAQDEAAAAAPNSASRVRRRRRGAPHICPHCARTFKRSEHLDRHVRTHTKEKPFICRCGAAFTRRDLLTRHHRISFHQGEAIDSTPAPEPDLATAAAAESLSSLSGLSANPWVQQQQQQQQAHLQQQHQQQQQHHQLQQQHQHQQQQQQQPASTQVYVDATKHQAQQRHQQQQQRPLDPQDAVVSHTYNQSLIPTQIPPMFDQCQNMNGFEQFREFADFLDGVGLPSEWSPYFQNPDMTETLQREPQSPHVGGNSYPSTRPGTRPGTPFSSWLPSAPAGNKVASHQAEENSKRPEAGHPFSRITDEQRSQLNNALQNYRDLLDPDFQLPSRHALSRYINSYIDGFLPHLVFMHVPTWRVLDSPIELILSVAAIGAQYCFEQRSSERLFRAGRSILIEKLVLERDRFGPKTSGLLEMKGASPRRGVNAYSISDSSTLYGSPPGESLDPIDTVRALINLMGYATWEMKVVLLAEAFSLQNLLINVLRDLGLEEEPKDPKIDAEDVPLQVRWHAWVRQESVRRAKLIAFSFIHTHSVAYDTFPSLRSNEIHLRLPCYTKEWKATSAIAWQAARAEVKKEQLHFQEALSLLLRDVDSALDPVPTPIGNYILLHGLLQRIYIVRELSVPIMDQSASLPAEEVEKLDRGLRSWTTSWQQAPESSLDPNNENGPIPFTSSSLLGLAYVRIYLNLGPNRKLETRDPNRVARALAECPNVERSDNVISALLYATHALSIPVRLGIDRVARSQAFFWSVRHSLSALDCAVLLSKWLACLPNSIDTLPLNGSEDRIFHWVKCIVEEAYSVVDFDEQDVAQTPTDPRGLSLAVLKIWARFFKGNAQWPFINMIGASLEKYHELLVRCYGQTI